MDTTTYTFKNIQSQHVNSYTSSFKQFQTEDSKLPVDKLPQLLRVVGGNPTEPQIKSWSTGKDFFTLDEFLQICDSYPPYTSAELQLIDAFRAVNSIDSVPDLVDIKAIQRLVSEFGENKLSQTECQEFLALVQKIAGGKSETKVSIESLVKELTK
jgi:Ca2+-binding EF-hand superfamily protein